jgi:hypothetical protein
LPTGASALWTLASLELPVLIMFVCVFTNAPRGEVTRACPPFACTATKPDISCFGPVTGSSGSRKLLRLLATMPITGCCAHAADSR